MKNSVDEYFRKRCGKVRRWFPGKAEDSAKTEDNWHGIAIVAPLYDEDFTPTLVSLKAAFRFAAKQGLLQKKGETARVYCVVNNRASDSPEIKKRNGELLVNLADYCRETPRSPGEALSLIALDAATEGREIPEGEGVGFARKIGMDFALLEGASVIACMDGDTLVSENYIEVLYNFMHSAHEVDAALTSFEHQTGVTEEAEKAIRAYERFLSDHRRKLEACGSIYYQTALGPTIVCTREAYMQSGGMNTRTAGEDFYFLQALTKTCYGKGRLPGTLPATVYPSTRVSARVPFGTGQKIGEIIAGAAPPAFPDSVYEQIGGFIALMNNSIKTRGSCAEISEKIKLQLPAVYDILIENKFFRDWGKIQQNAAGIETQQKAFQFWFDGLKIIRLIHRLDGLFTRA
jgi:hypothetical protein